MSRSACPSSGRRSITARRSTSRGRGSPIRRVWWRRCCWRQDWRLRGPPKRRTLQPDQHPMADKTDREKAQQNIAENRKAHHDFHLLETFEAGVVLLGTEVKAIREGRVNLSDSYAGIEDGELFLFNVNISPYSHRG